MKRIKVYIGWGGNIFVTDKEIPAPYDFDSSFESVTEAEDWVINEYNVDPILDRDIIEESMYDFSGDDMELYTFDFNEFFGYLL